MTQEYEFFKDFAGVTKADLEMFKCGGKKKKMAEGAKVDTKKANQPGVKTKKDKIWDENEEANIHSYPNSRPKQDPDTIVHNTVTNEYYRYANGKTKPATKTDFEKGRKGKKK